MTLWWQEIVHQWEDILWGGHWCHQTLRLLLLSIVDRFLAILFIWREPGEFGWVFHIFHFYLSWNSNPEESAISHFTFCIGYSQVGSLAFHLNASLHIGYPRVGSLAFYFTTSQSVREFINAFHTEKAKEDWCTNWCSLFAKFNFYIIARWIYLGFISSLRKWFLA